MVAAMIRRALLIAAVLAGPTLAQDRAAAERQTLGELAYALGESHALRQLCAGPGDQYWRDRMLRLTQVENSDEALDAVLRARFNLGFAPGQSQATACNGASRRAEAAAASRGQALAQTLSRVMRRNAPPPQTPQEPPVEP